MRRYDYAVEKAIITKAKGLAREMGWIEVLPMAGLINTSRDEDVVPLFVL